MSFDSAFQPILTNVGNLALSCVRVDVDAASVGWFSEANFAVEGEVRGIKTGYPLRVTEMALQSMGARASVNFQELGGPFKSILSGIISSLNTGIVPTHDLLLEVFRPRAENITINMQGAAVLQQFDLNFGDDFNAVNLEFEQLVGQGQTLDGLVTFSTLGEITNASTTPLLSKDNVSIGKPLVKVDGVSLGAVQGVSLSLSTEYRRVLAGYPNTLMALTPLEHNVTLTVESEEFTEASLDELLLLGATKSVSFSAALYDGTAIVITLPEARLTPDGINLPSDDFSTIKKKFIATGATLLTIA